jgi:STE24 endopeptidase
VAVLLLVPFVLWDVILYILRRRGDTSAARRGEVLRHFTEEDIAAGREQVKRRLVLYPLGRLLYYGVFGALLFGGLGARLEAVLLQLAGHWALALPLYVLCILATWSLLQLPLAAASELYIERRAGLSTTTLGTFLADQAKGLVVGWILTTLVAFPVIGLLRWLPVWWPLPAAAALVAISAFAAWLSPWLIAPLFNKFYPLDDGELAEEVKALAARAGMKIPGGVLVTDASRRSTTLNAYFTGLGNSRRVVLFDTLVESCEADETLSTVAHELGHWKHHHIAKLFVLESLGAVVGLLLLELLLESPFRTSLGVPQPESLVFLVLVVFLASLAGVLTAPIGAAVSRRFERQADGLALDLTENPGAFIKLEKRLMRRAKADLLTPKLLHWMYGTHPLPEQRIHAAESHPAAQDARM